MGLIRDRRTTFAVVLSVLVFAWCIGSASSDNRRWLENLHKGHQSATFQDALAKLKARPGWETMDECNVCHEDRSWMSNVIYSMAPVRDTACLHCHRPVPPGSKLEAGAARTSLGLPFLGTRANRPAHMRVDLPGKTAGLPIPGDGELKCADCHPEHEGLQSMVRVKVDEGQRLRITRECLRCHLPSEPSPEATMVLKEFIDGHKGDNAFDPKIPPSAVKAIADAPANQPLPKATQAAFVRDVLDTLGQQVFLGDKSLEEEAQPLRGCTPGCHGEHTVGTGDADDKKYRPETPETATLAPVRWRLKVKS